MILHNEANSCLVLCILKATVEPMQIDTGPEDADANRVMVESTTLVNV